MLVSDGGQLIRVPVGGIRLASRATKGVTIFSTAKDEKVVSVERISEPEPEEDEDGTGQTDALDDDAPATRAAGCNGRIKPAVTLSKGRAISSSGLFCFKNCLRTCNRQRKTGLAGEPSGFLYQRDWRLPLEETSKIRR